MIVPLFPNTGMVDTFWTTFFVILAGLLGALVRELIDGNLTLPSVRLGILNLGFIGGLIIGAVAGFYLGDSVLGAFSFGLSASFLIKNIIKKSNNQAII